MSLRRSLVALVLAVAWCAAALHSDLEAAGLTHDHVHHHGHAAHGHEPAHHESAPLAGLGDSHDPFWVAHVFKGSLALAAPLLSTPLWIALALGAAAHLLIALRPFPEQRRRRRPQDHPTAWQFVWRCAAESAAPPALR